MLVNSSSDQDPFGLITMNLTRQDFPAAKAYLCLSTAEKNQQLLTHLTPNELKQLSSIRVQKRRAEFIVSRLAAKVAAANYLNVKDLRSFEVHHGVFSQPLLNAREIEAAKLAELPGISISHSEGVCAAISFHASHIIGIDFEHILSANLDAMTLACNSREIEFTRGLGITDSISKTLLWTVKESISKAIKTGLMAPFNLFEVESVEAVDSKNDLFQLFLKSSSFEFQPTLVSISKFKNFLQYKTVSWISAHSILSITLPRRTQIVSVRELKHNEAA